MKESNGPIREVDDLSIKTQTFRKHLADALILRHDNTFYLQSNNDNKVGVGSVHLFGGHIETGESPLIALIREINEETGGIPLERDIIFLGAVTEEWTGHQDIIYTYLWCDKENTITGCYERSPISFNSLEELLACPNLMEYGRWAITRAIHMGLLTS